MDHETVVGFLIIPCQVPAEEYLSLGVRGKLQPSRNKSVHLAYQGEHGEVRQLLLPNSTDTDTDLLQAAGRLVSQKKVELIAEVVHVDGTTVLIKLDLHLPVGLWTAPTHWSLSPNPTAVLVLNNLQPHSVPVTQAVQEALAQAQQLPAVDHYSLMSCFKELPSCSKVAPLPAMVHADTVAASLGTNLADIPADIMEEVLSQLMPKDIARASRTCRYFQHVAWRAVTGLNLTLYRHQMAALRWMMEHEALPTAEPPHPHITRLTTPIGLEAFADLSTGEVTTEEPTPLPPLRGGFFCDEPGMGKTVTALALILKTQGRTPEPPPGARVTWTPYYASQHDGDGNAPRLVGFYVPAAHAGGHHARSRVQSAPQRSTRSSSSAGALSQGLAGPEPSSSRRSGRHTQQRGAGEGGGAPGRTGRKGTAAPKTPPRSDANSICPAGEGVPKDEEDMLLPLTDLATGSPAALHLGEGCGVSAGAVADDGSSHKGSQRDAADRDASPVRKKQRPNSPLCGSAMVIAPPHSAGAQQAVFVDVGLQPALQDPPRQNMHPAGPDWEPSGQAALVPEVQQDEAPTDDRRDSSLSGAGTWDCLSQPHAQPGDSHAHTPWLDPAAGDPLLQAGGLAAMQASSPCEKQRGMLLRFRLPKSPQKGSPPLMKLSSPVSQHDATPWPAKPTTSSSQHMTRECMAAPNMSMEDAELSSLQHVNAGQSAVESGICNTGQQDGTAPSALDHTTPSALQDDTRAVKPPQTSSPLNSVALAGSVMAPRSSTASPPAPSISIKIRLPKVVPVHRPASEPTVAPAQGLVRQQLDITTTAADARATPGIASNMPGEEAALQDDSTVKHSQALATAGAAGFAGRSFARRTGGQPRHPAADDPALGSAKPVCAAPAAELAAGSMPTALKEANARAGRRGRDRKPSAAGRKRRRGSAPREASLSPDPEPCQSDGELATPVDVQCDLCQKWRRLPVGCAVDPDKAWFCHLYPIPGYRSCSLPQGAEPGASSRADCHYTSCPGFVDRGEAQGDTDNVEHFRQLLASYPTPYYNSSCPLLWIANTAAQGSWNALRTGFTVPRTRRSVDYAETFKKLELRPSRPSAGAERSSNDSAKEHGTAQDALHTWHLPAEFFKLDLDGKALLQALQCGPKGQERRIYLSAATLVVVPQTLIQHWQEQIRRHVATGRLRCYVLDGPAPELQPHELAWNYDVVVTTFNRLSTDWSGEKSERGDVLLMQVHWLRIILDEGHMLGNSLAITNKLQMACEMLAERRWVMTGTPIPATAASDIAHLQPLLAFLHHAPYGTNRKSWEVAVQKPFDKKRPEGRSRLMALLRSCMIRASKADLINLAKCFRKTTLLDFSRHHADSYNALLEVVHRNLLLADWFDEDHNESLLNARTAKRRGKDYGRQMLNNLRQSCCIAGNVDVMAKEEDVLEMLQLLAGRNDISPRPPASVEESRGVPYLTADHALAAVEQVVRKGGTCQRCAARTLRPIITPCCHVLCLNCTKLDCERCPHCGVAYAMQAVDDPDRKKDNPNPKWPVPKELIEWQPVYHQRGAIGEDGGEWQVKWQVTTSSKCTYLLQRLYEVEAAVRVRPADVAADKISEPKTKAIVFSQFWMHLGLVSMHLANHKVGFCMLKKDTPAARKDEALLAFRTDPRLGVLLMDEVGALGLDLSCVTHVFLMEPIADRSVEVQVISRAHRMGARKDVHVEVLVMKHTIEQSMEESKDVAREQQPLTTRETQMPADLGAGGLLPILDSRAARNKLLLAVRTVPVADLKELEDPEEGEQAQDPEERSLDHGTLVAKMDAIGHIYQPKHVLGRLGAEAILLQAQGPQLNPAARPAARRLALPGSEPAESAAGGNREEAPGQPVAHGQPQRPARLAVHEVRAGPKPATSAAAGDDPMRDAPLASSQGDGLVLPSRKRMCFDSTAEDKPSHRSLQDAAASEGVQLHCSSAAVDGCGHGSATAAPAAPQGLRVFLADSGSQLSASSGPSQTAAPQCRSRVHFANPTPDDLAVHQHRTQLGLSEVGVQATAPPRVSRVRFADPTPDSTGSSAVHQYCTQPGTPKMVGQAAAAPRVARVRFAGPTSDIPAGTGEEEHRGRTQANDASTAAGGLLTASRTTRDASASLPIANPTCMMSAERNLPKHLAGHQPARQEQQQLSEGIPLPTAGSPGPSNGALIVSIAQLSLSIGGPSDSDAMPASSTSRIRMPAQRKRMRVAQPLAAAMLLPYSNGQEKGLLPQQAPPMVQ